MDNLRDDTLPENEIFGENIDPEILDDYQSMGFDIFGGYDPRYGGAIRKLKDPLISEKDRTKYQIFANEFRIAFRKKIEKQRAAQHEKEESSRAAIRKILYSVSFRNILKLRAVSKSWLCEYRKMNIHYLLSKIKDIKDRFIFYLSFYLHLPKQRSKEWLKARGGDVELKAIMAPPSIGGSEVSAVIGESKYGNELKVMRDKLGLSDFKGNIATRWGKAFESIITKLFEVRSGAKVYEAGAIPSVFLTDENGFPLVRYSSDGLLCVENIVLKRILEQENVDYINDEKFIELFKKNERLIINLEIKCPLRTIPNGIVPAHYCAQPKTGACTLPVVDISVFINNMIRKCSISDFGFNPKYDTKFHPAFKRNMIIPKICGFVGFYEQNNAIPICTKNDTQIIKNIVQNVRNCIMVNVTSKGTDFYAMSVVLENIPKFIHLAYKYLPQELKYDEKMQFLIVWNTIRTLFLSALKESQELETFKKNELIYKKLSLSSFEVESISSYDFGRLEFGKDFGSNEDTERAFELFDSDDYKIYYPNNFYFPVGHLWGSSSVDTVISESDRAHRWLWKETFSFCQFCYLNGYKPVGIMPWKLIKCDYIPVYKDKNFITKHESKIRYVTSKILEIKKKALQAGPYKSQAYIEVCKKELTNLYGTDGDEEPAKKPDSVKKPDPKEKPDPPETLKSDEIDEFNNEVTQLVDQETSEKKYYRGGFSQDDMDSIS